MNTRRIEKRSELPVVIVSVVSLSLTLFLSCPASFAATKFEQFNEAAEAAYKNRNYPEAEKNFEAALKESDKLDKDDKRLATTNYNLALAFQAEGKYSEAEKYMLKALELTSSFYGADHQRTAQVYMDLADMYLEEAGQIDKPELKKQAAENYKKGIEIFEKIYAQAAESDGGPEKSAEPKKSDGDKKSQSAKATPQEAAADLSNALRVLADSYAQDEVYDQAEPLYKRSLELEEFASGAESKDLAKHKASLAEVYCVQAKYKLAEPYFKDALEISEKLNGVDSPTTAEILYKYGGMHYDNGEFAEAEIKFKRALKIFARASDANPLDLAQKNITLADVLDMQGKSEEAQVIYNQSEGIFEKSDDKAALIRFLKQYQKHFLMQNKKEDAAKIALRIKETKASLTQDQTKKD